MKTENITLDRVRSVTESVLSRTHNGVTYLPNVTMILHALLRDIEHPIMTKQPEQSENEHRLAVLDFIEDWRYRKGPDNE